MKTFCLTLIATLGMVVTTVAQESGATCPEGKCPAAQCADGQCPVTAGMELLPKISWIVGEESICCPDMAKAKSEETESPIIYVVGDQKFEDNQTAYANLVEQTEQFVSTFASPAKCEKSGSIAIGGKSCDCPVKAGEMEVAIRTAMESVNVAYKVGEHTCNCPNEAAELAKKDQTDVHFVVGETETCCPLESRLNLARARYKAALMALNPPAESGAAATETSGGSNP